MDTASSTPTADVHAPSSDATPTPAPVVPPAPADKGSWGGLIGIILIVLLIIMAAFYSWGERLETQAPLQTVE